MSAAKPAQPIRLHTTLLSGHGHRVKLFLTLLDLPFEVIELDMRAGDNRRPEYLKLNPFGQVPTIEDGDTVLFDSNAILVYLAKRYGDPSWLPDDALGAAAVQRWLSLAAGQIAYGPCAARLVTVFGAPLNLETAQKIALKLFDVLDAELASKHFAAGDRVSIADIAAHTYIAHAPEGGISLEPYQNIRAWLRRVEALPRFIAMPATKAGLVAA
ncbi:Disulfide-bond oxidoreductase YfcG [Paraburkholderia domus]|jgi:Glutathione S-transferase|uniref:glutathione S-transferase family protein n=1 Tax=Paraburkholderia domus TaxID=2793075 RepID=UPI0019130BCA|nr:glutathione S-transferase [Paraburkholderia domus]MBK5052142.1 glutathione S-transferase [Burkholderia sp. R-70006]MBK5064297.1 glutathione S-transferase [Burkholderia sp. R-70199]MBK5089236.1 glutathione S-transferase [Burkholderia sp. R-69927]MBK5122709.1 glutathione S-transferase [Burkholderia sp. R-69980]MCI0149632.1 glutathione S-transferase N-terminal domain-containing protein [Paraburkholderia sediminicola]